MKETERHYVAIGAIIKNEGPYIEEWIEYHLNLGIEKFYIVDNGSCDNTLEILKRYIVQGTVELYSTEEGQAQLSAYNHIIQEHAEDTRWIAFIDADEFIYLRGNQTISEFLAEYEDENAIGVNWICIGTSGKRNKPNGLVIENYTQAMSLQSVKNKMIKTILQPKKALSFSSPHYCLYKDNRNAVDENHDYLDGNEEISLELGRAFSYNNSTKRIAIIHYFTKSEEEYYYRSMRGKACGYFDNYNVFANGLEQYYFTETFEFTEMLQYVSTIKKRIPSKEFVECPNKIMDTNGGIARKCEEMKIIQKGICSILEQHKKVRLSDNRSEIFEECQEIAIKIGNLVEAICGENRMIELLEIYCEKVYEMSMQTEISKLDIENLDLSILDAGYCLIV